MVNVSIISDCNNNCKYCFQGHDYHKRNLMLTYEDIEDILRWSQGDRAISLMGGEPTLHPDIVRIIERCARERHTIILTNLLGPTNIIEEILVKCPKIEWLVNTTTRDELVDLFETNIKILRKYNVIITAGITLTLDKELDTKFINNLIKIGKEYSDIVHFYRIGQATPYEKGQIDLRSFYEPVKTLCKLAEKETIWIPISFDCSINHCQFSEKELANLIKLNGVKDITNAEKCKNMIEILADKSVVHCSSLPAGIFKRKKYYEFNSYIDCNKYLEEQKNSFQKKYRFLCKEYKKKCDNSRCCSTKCIGTCFALSAHVKNYFDEQKALSKKKLT